ncbi:MAG: hypothetical protein AAGI30_09190 [Planctomycetota bacterium]
MFQLIARRASVLSGALVSMVAAMGVAPAASAGTALVTPAVSTGVAQITPVHHLPRRAFSTGARHGHSARARVLRPQGGVGSRVVRRSPGIDARRAGVRDLGFVPGVRFERAFGRTAERSVVRRANRSVRRGFGHRRFRTLGRGPRRLH